jgi:hypothetical protein
LNSEGAASHDRPVLELLILIGRGLTLAFRGHHEFVFENLALRQQLLAVAADHADAGGSNGTRLRLWKWELQPSTRHKRIRIGDIALAFTICGARYTDSA